MPDLYIRELESRFAEAQAAIEQVRALHSPKPGWEREWIDPAEALAKGWPMCTGCELPGLHQREIGKCPTLHALDGVP